MSLIKKILKAAFFLILTVPFLYVVSIYRETYDIIKARMEFKPALSSRLYDRNGKLIAELYDEKRLFISFDRISPDLKNAVLAAEDRDFYMHRGFDPASMVRAFLVDVFHAGAKQGGSTLTQQLAKQLYTKSQKTIHRKIAELFIAMELERQYTKDQIFEMYCNQIYLGHGLYGVQSASLFFFHKGADEIGPGEASVLASLPAAPGRYSPLKDPAASMTRSRAVLSAMTEEGMIDGDEARKEYRLFWEEYIKELSSRFPTENIREVEGNRAPYFTEYVRQFLIKRFGEECVYRQGLVVQTTLDLRHQKTAEKLISEAAEKQNRIAYYKNTAAIKGLDRIGAREFHRLSISRYRYLRDEIADELTMAGILFGFDRETDFCEKITGRFQEIKRRSRAEGALVSLDVKTGGITAMVGGSRFSVEDQVNRACQSFRQPGSAFKAFVYGAAIGKCSITPATPFIDLPLVFHDGDKSWSPANYSRNFCGLILARQALASSVNTVSVMIYDDTGGSAIAKFASKMTGVPEKRFVQDPTLALGSSELSPLEMASGFSVYAADGIRRPPFAVLSVKDSEGNEIYRYDIEKEEKKVLSRETSAVMNSMLKTVMTSGTASGAMEKAGFSYSAAGKTGTSSKFRDAWFTGYTKDICATVWLGCNSQTFSLGDNQDGGRTAAPIWASYMKTVCALNEPGKLNDSAPGLIHADICPVTGLLAGENCRKVNEIFMSGTVPSEFCDGIHQPVDPSFMLEKRNGQWIINTSDNNPEEEENQEDEGELNED